ncbi:TIGR04149 family rSAM-modified RiPP [Dysgonomonas sp. 25]|uniref:TIGR04149 family rSAM-modified RiPP n=1 Tax=Dysgonomonas sp. 25 TaxID=2302933 RepID=UPI0013D6F181|nr:TIGR04149 family rSAM-modified RiPP [Dysgonomonas sp. 25]NDV67926.1 rSAM-modified peptide [Dysgonomonas sp. 25]
MKLKKLKLLDAEILSDTEMKNVFGGQDSSYVCNSNSYSTTIYDGSGTCSGKCRQKNVQQSDDSWRMVSHSCQKITLGSGSTALYTCDCKPIQ